MNNTLKWILLGVGGLGGLGALIWWLRWEEAPKVIEPAKCTEVAQGEHRRIPYTVESCVGPATGETYYFGILRPPGFTEPERSPIGFTLQTQAVEWLKLEIDKRLAASAPPPPAPPTPPTLNIKPDLQPVTPVKQATLIGGLSLP